MHYIQTQNGQVYIKKLVLLCNLFRLKILEHRDRIEAHISKAVGLVFQIDVVNQ